MTLPADNRFYREKEHTAQVETEVTEAPVPQLPALATPKTPVEPARKRSVREPSIANIATAIANITRETGIVAKAGFNQFHRYKYATMQDVLQKLTPLIAKHGIVIVQTEVGRSMFDDDRAVAVQYEFTIAHTSGEMWPDRPKQTGLCRCRDSKGGFDDKALNKAHTAARKYFLLALFQIATGEEDDADQHDTGGRRPPLPAPNAIGRATIDPQTGEITESAAPAQDKPAVDTAPENPPNNSGAALSLEDMAREAAMHGEPTFKAFYKARTGEEKKILNSMGDELRGLMAESGR